MLFPEVKEEYFDEVVERQVRRMQTVIELTRNIRERLNLSLKVGNSSSRGGTNPDIWSADTSQRAAGIPRRFRVAE